MTRVVLVGTVALLLSINFSIAFAGVEKKITEFEFSGIVAEALGNMEAPYFEGFSTASVREVAKKIFASQKRLDAWRFELQDDVSKLSYGTVEIRYQQLPDHLRIIAVSGDRKRVVRIYRSGSIQSDPLLEEIEKSRPPRAPEPPKPIVPIAPDRGARIISA